MFFNLFICDILCCKNNQIKYQFFDYIQGPKLWPLSSSSVNYLEWLCNPSYRVFYGDWLTVLINPLFIFLLAAFGLFLLRIIPVFLLMMAPDLYNFYCPLLPLSLNRLCLVFSFDTFWWKVDGFLDCPWGLEVSFPFFMFYCYVRFSFWGFKGIDILFPSS